MSPKSQERIFEKKYAYELLQIAKDDFESALVLAGSSKGRPENTLFLAQQSIEKALKAVLVKHGVGVPLVHDLGVLLAKLPRKFDPPHGYELNELSQYASVRRYSEGQYEVTPEELNQIMTKVREMLNWCEQNV